MITIVHNQDGVEVQAFKSDRKICDPRVRDHVSYVTGVNRPNYPVPAIPVKVGYQPKGGGEWDSHSYVYVCSLDMLWTFWSHSVLIVEHIKNGLEIKYYDWNGERMQ